MAGVQVRSGIPILVDNPCCASGMPSSSRCSRKQSLLPTIHEIGRGFLPHCQSKGCSRRCPTRISSVRKLASLPLLPEKLIPEVVRSWWPSTFCWMICSVTSSAWHPAKTAADEPKDRYDNRQPEKSIRRLIADGEGRTLEFKSTMRMNLHTQNSILAPNCPNTYASALSG